MCVCGYLTVHRHVHTPLYRSRNLISYSYNCVYIQPRIISISLAIPSHWSFNGFATVRLQSNLSTKAAARTWWRQEVKAGTVKAESYWKALLVISCCELLAGGDNCSAIVIKFRWVICSAEPRWTDFTYLRSGVIQYSTKPKALWFAIALNAGVRSTWPDLVFGFRPAQNQNLHILMWGCEVQDSVCKRVFWLRLISSFQKSEVLEGRFPCIGVKMLRISTRVTRKKVVQSLFPDVRPWIRKVWNYSIFHASKVFDLFLTFSVSCFEARKSLNKSIQHRSSYRDSQSILW